MSNNWQPLSWQQKHSEQQPDYKDRAAVERVCKELGQLPPLVSIAEITQLKNQLAEAAEGNRFILQGGDCAELFTECNDGKISEKIKILLQISLILVKELSVPVTRIGRLAGQYAKPRSSESETQGEISLPCYRGDLINAIQFDAKAREPDPDRMLQGYGLASLTLNYIRSLKHEVFANIENPEHWHLQHFANSDRPHYRQYHQQLSEFLSTLSMMATLDRQTLQNTIQSTFFSSHEALLLPYESALTRQFENQWYNLSTHFPWIGMRTAQSQNGHVEYMKGIQNPIGLKVSASMSADTLEKLICQLDPDNEPGRLTLIHRFGSKQITHKLPTLIKRLQEMNYRPLWICDPMHGNTLKTTTGHKTRHFRDIAREIQLAFECHQQHNSHLGGVHLELTADPVTECLGGTVDLREVDLQRDYRSYVDPRLNAQQSIEMAFVIAEMMQKNNKSLLTSTPRVS